MSIVDSVKRLERAGSEGSRATEKLHEAAGELAGLVEKIVPVGVSLPRDYVVVLERSNVDSERFLVKQDQDLGRGPQDLYIDGTGTYLHGDFRCPIPGKTRAGSLLFAKDVAEGWLDELAAFLEERKRRDDEAAATLEAAARTLEVPA